MAASVSARQPLLFRVSSEEREKTRSGLPFCCSAGRLASRKVAGPLLSLMARAVSVRRKPLLRLAVELDPFRLSSNGSSHSPRHPFPTGRFASATPEHETALMPASAMTRRQGEDCKKTLVGSWHAHQHGSSARSLHGYRAFYQREKKVLRQVCPAILGFRSARPLLQMLLPSLLVSSS